VKSTRPVPAILCFVNPGTGVGILVFHIDILKSDVLKSLGYSSVKIVNKMEPRRSTIKTVGLHTDPQSSEVDAGLQMKSTLSRTTLDAAGSVAVVITTYNHAAFLDDALRSVVHQSVPADEIIVVDDGSTDHPDMVVSGYTHVRLIRQRNQGLSAARNTGMKAAMGDKIIFLDADDRLCQDAIEAGLECFVRHSEAGFVYGGFHLIDAGGGVTGDPVCRDIGPHPHNAFLRGNQVGMHGTVMYDRMRLLDAGGFDVTLRRCEDYDIYLRMSRIHPVANHRHIVAEYRRHGANMSANSLEMLRSVQRVLARYKPPAMSALATVAWRQGQAYWRRYYFEEILRFSSVRRIVDAVRASPTLTARHLIRRLERALPRGLIFTLKRLAGRRPPPPLGRVRFGDFDRPSPISRDFGFDRGTPVDRYYIEAFLAKYSGDIRGRALEVGDAFYCRKFGTGIVRQDVLHVATDNPEATIVGDLSVPGVLPEGAFDCLVITQTLHLIYDMHAAVAAMYRALKPGGVLLLTCPGISQVDRREWGATWFWSITQRAAERMFADVFGAANVAVENRGNVYAAVCFLEGLALEEVDAAKLDVLDAAYPIIVTVHARKPEET
jgi:glycosyltransferase involved in cell wall biosynthesis/SAM-dependent methyltransferase